MATLTFDNATFERAEVAAAREGRSVYDLLNATLVDYAATVPLSKVDDGIKVGADGYPEFKVNRDAACIVKPVAYREDGVGLHPRWDETERLIEDELYRSAAELIKQRFPSGWGGAAAMRLECRDDTPARIVTSVAIETPNASASLCIETGAMCEAMKRNQRITHAICLVRDNENSPFIVLSPCGICQERLRYWGNDVRCAITDNTNDGRILFLRLDDLQPHHWTQAYPTSELEHFDY